MTPSQEVKRKFIKSLKGCGFKVKSDTGWSDIKYCHKTIKYDTWELRTDRHKLRCADTHIIFRSNTDNEVLDEVYVKDLVNGDLIHTSDGCDIVQSVTKLDYSEHMYDLELDDKNHRFYTSHILSHNSATTRAYILWYSLFNPDKVVAILANKLNLAQEQLQQLRDSYIALPMWMQPGVKQWNKRGIQFSHGTRIVCAATSPDGIRGMSINLLYLDEFAFVKSHLAEEFIASVFPTISSGKTTKVIITSTPSGMNHFFRMWEDGRFPEEEETDDHNGYIKSEIPWNAKGLNRDEAWARDEIKKIGEIRFNQEYKCDFVGSVSTLIDHNFLKTLKSRKPLNIPKLPEYMKIYELPRRKEELETKNWEYIASLDSGYGVHQDYSVLHIFLVKSNITVHQVVTIAANNMEIEEFCKKCYVILKKYHYPGLIIEQNGPGGVATNFFYGQAEYENLLHFDPKGQHMGLWASAKLKQNACILFKTYIQRKFMHLYDKETINELHSFGRLTQEKWGGLGGNHDDRITAAYWIPYYLQSPFYYGNIVEVNLKSLEEEEVILKTQDQINEERTNLSQMQDPKYHQKMLGDAAEYLSDKQNPDNDDDQTMGLMFRM